MGRTPERLVDLLQKEIPTKISRNKFCIQTGINQNSIDKYMAGIAEPTQATMEKLSIYFKLPVAYLRGDTAPYINFEDARLMFELDKASSAYVTEHRDMIVEIMELWNRILKNLFGLDIQRLQQVKTTFSDLLKKTSGETKEQIAERQRLAEKEGKRRKEQKQLESDLEAEKSKFEKQGVIFGVPGIPRKKPE